MAFVGELRIFAGNFAPAGWMLCQGQLLPISEYETLFNLIGTTYGGDGQQDFALPDLRGRLPLHNGQGSGLSSFVIGQSGGAEEVTITANQLPVHSHPLVASSDLASSPDPADKVLAQSRTAGVDLYLEDTTSVTMAASSIGQAGGSQPHTNLQPFLCLNFIISLFGIYPTT